MQASTVGCRVLDRCGDFMPVEVREFSIRHKANKNRTRGGRRARHPKTTLPRPARSLARVSRLLEDPLLQCIIFKVANWVRPLIGPRLPRDKDDIIL